MRQAILRDIECAGAVEPSRALSRSPAMPLREFRVNASHLDSHHARHVTETSFEAAAVSYIEYHPYAADEDREIRVVVREVFSGQEHCFKIDLETGKTQSCG